MNSPISRDSCLECVDKHLGAALVLIGETRDGYPHRLRAIGHLHEAEDESQAWPALHDAIRAARKHFQQTGEINFAAVETIRAGLGAQPLIAGLGRQYAAPMQTALIIGDSHVEPAGAFGPDLAALLTAQGYSVVIAGVGSSNAHQWANQQVVCRPDKSWCVDQSQLPHSPDLLVISLGTNDAANAAAGGASPGASVADVKRVIANYSPGRYFWIGPPSTNDTVPYYTNAAIANYYAAAKASSLSIFDSRSVTAPLVAAHLGDGVHLYGSGAQAWANAAAKAIEAQSSYKMKIAFGLATAAVIAILWRKGFI